MERYLPNMPDDATHPALRPSDGIEDFLARSAAGSKTIAFYRDELWRLERRLGAPLATASQRQLTALKAELRTAKSGAGRCRMLRTFYRAVGRPDAVEILKLKRGQSRLDPNEILTIVEVNAMIAAANSLRDRAFITVLWETGSRVTEVCALNVGNVNEFVTKENGGKQFLQVFFPTVKVKGEEHSSLLVEGVGHVMAWLKAYAPDREGLPMFPSARGGPAARLTKDGAEALVRKTAERAGIRKHITPHSFRHARATHLLRIGVPEAQVKKLLGWRPNSPMLGRYSHLVDRDAYAALLRAHGLEPPKPETHESLIAADAELKPVLPIVSFPRQRGPALVDLPLEDQARLIAKAIAEDQEQRPHARPWWEDDANAKEVFEDVKRLRQELRDELQRIRESRGGA